MSSTHRLDSSVVHYEWNNAIPPRLVVDPGDTIVVDTRDAGDGYYTPTSTSRDTAARGPLKGHPLSGPIAVRGARPGDVLVVEIVAMEPAPFGWTHIRPGRGLLPEAEFPESFLQIWNLEDRAVARMRARSGARVAVPLAPFPGVLGTALDEPGGHSTAPPRKNGGNMDIKQLTAGATVYLPVWVDGGLLSVGDGHGAQGDGEVCISAVEMSARVTLRVGLRQGRPLQRASAPDERVSPEPGRGVRDDGARSRPVPVRPAGRSLPGRPPGRGARAHARGGLRRGERGRGPSDQRDRRRAELDRLGVHPGVDLRVDALDPRRRAALRGHGARPSGLDDEAAECRERRAGIADVRHRPEVGRQPLRRELDGDVAALAGLWADSAPPHDRPAGSADQRRSCLERTVGQARPRPPGAAAPGRVEREHRRRPPLDALRSRVGARGRDRAMDRGRHPRGRERRRQGGQRSRRHGCLLRPAGRHPKRRPARWRSDQREVNFP